jgi:phenylalanine-4-hydroxylase
MLGHAPLFADPDFANFSQSIGLASLGASDEIIEQLARCYWYTVEFGLCKQVGGVKAYGAGILSSFGELDYALSGKPELLPWDPAVASQKPYPITTYQPTYFVAEDFKDAQVKLEKWIATLDRPFQVEYNGFTNRVYTYPKSAHSLLQ